MRWGLWWFAIVTAYIVEFAAQNLGEVAAAFIIAALCATIVATALRTAHVGVQVRWRWLSHLARVPPNVLRDVVLVAGRIVWALRTGQALTGFVERIPYDTCERDDPFELGREALVIFGICAAPNTIVADVDPRGALVVHRLVAGASAPESKRWPL